jgi:hypothetical protein
LRKLIDRRLARIAIERPEGSPIPALAVVKETS